jgi:hypothetical protein
MREVALQAGGLLPAARDGKPRTPKESAMIGKKYREERPGLIL